MQKKNSDRRDNNNNNNNNNNNQCRAVAVVQCAAGMVEWTKEELQIMDRKTRKLMILHHVLYIQANIDRLYFKGSESGRGLMSVEDSRSVKSEINSLSSWDVKSSHGHLLQAVYKEEVLRCYAKICEAASLQQERKEHFQEK